MPPSTPRTYRIVHYPAVGHVLTKDVQLAWDWDWRYGKDPVLECRAASEAQQSLDQRSAALIDDINAEIATGRAASGRRPGLLGAEDRLGNEDRELVRRDLLTVQVGIAMLSALAAKAVLDAYRQRG